MPACHLEGPIVAAPLQLMAMDRHSADSGLASSLQAACMALTGGVIAGAIAPSAMSSLASLSACSLLMLALGLIAWLGIRRAETLRCTVP